MPRIGWSRRRRARPGRDRLSGTHCGSATPVALIVARTPRSLPTRGPELPLRRDRGRDRRARDRGLLEACRRGAVAAARRRRLATCTSCVWRSRGSAASPTARRRCRDGASLRPPSTGTRTLLRTRSAAKVDPDRFLRSFRVRSVADPRGSPRGSPRWSSQMPGSRSWTSTAELGDEPQCVGDGRFRYRSGHSASSTTNRGRAPGGPLIDGPPPPSRSRRRRATGSRGPRPRRPTGSASAGSARASAQAAPWPGRSGYP